MQSGNDIPLNEISSIDDAEDTSFPECNIVSSRAVNVTKYSIPCVLARHRPGADIDSKKCIANAVQ